MENAPSQSSLVPISWDVNHDNIVVEYKSHYVKLIVRS